MLFLAIGLVVLFALSTVEAGVDLRTYADSVTDFDRGHLGPNLDGGADDF